MPEIPEWLKEILNDINVEDAKIVIENLENDKIISTETWNNFCTELNEEIINNNPNNPDEKEESFNNICQQYCLEGPSARIPPGVKILNRVISGSVFVTYGLKKSNTAYIEATLRRFSEKKIPEQQSKLKNFYLALPNRCV